MFADKLKSSVTRYNINDYNVYKITTQKGDFVVGSFPHGYDEQYVKITADAVGIILLTSKPDFSACVASVLDKRPDIEIYATSAGLRNIKEIVNRRINEKLIRDNAELPGASVRFYITPGLHWVDSVTVRSNGCLFTGELFSSGSHCTRREYYESVLSVNSSFVKAALERISDVDFDMICPALGDCISDRDIKDAIYDMLRLCSKEYHNGNKAAVIYASRYGFTRKLALKAFEVLNKSYDVKMLDVYKDDPACIKTAINDADILLVGTHTINRNAPKEIWDAITSIDLLNKRGTNYLVFGSFGWAGDGIKLVNSALASMGMKRMSKPFEVLFDPTEQDVSDFGDFLNRCIDSIVKE